MPVQPEVIKLKEMKFKCPYILSLPFNLHLNVFKFQIFNHFTFQVFILGNVFTKGIIFIQSMIRDKIWGEKFKKKFKSIKHKKHVNLVS